MADTKDQILERLLSDIDDKYDKTVGSFMYDTQKPRAIEDEKIYARVDKIADRAFVSTATGADLDEKLGEVALERRAATYAHGTVTVVGTPGTNVAAGTKVMSDLYLFTITAGAKIGESGAVDVPVICDTVGDAGNIPANSIKGFTISIAGLSEVSNTNAFSGGYDRETDEEARERYWSLAKKPPTSGNKYHYEAWAMEVSGVGSAKCIPRWNGPGTVKVLIIDKNREVADETLLKAVTDHIEAERPVGPEVTVVSADPLLINVSVALILQSGYAAETLKPQIETEITAYLKDIAFEQSYVSLAHIGKRILNINGVTDYEDLTINGGTSNIDIADDEVAALGVVTLE